jgi:hypothetical protein
VATTGRPRGLRVRTACTTEDEFIALYQRDCDDSSLFAATEKDIAAGADIAFSLELADGQPMLRGLGVVLSAWTTPQNRFGRVGLHIGFTQLTSASEPIHARLMEARAESQPRQRSNTRVRFGVIPTPPVLAKWPDEESVVGDVRRSITHEFEAVDPSSGAPVAPFDDRANHTERYEGPLRAPARAATPIPESAGMRAQAVPIDPKLSLPIPAPPRTAPTPAQRATEPMFARSAIEPYERPEPRAYRWLEHQLSRALERLTPAYRWTARKLAPVGSAIAQAYRALARRLEPVRRTRTYQWSAARATTAHGWLAPRLGSGTRRVVEVVRPSLVGLWHSRARTPIVFIAGILVGVIAMATLRSAPTSNAGAVAKAEHVALPIASAAPCKASETQAFAGAVPPTPAETVAAATPAKPARVTPKKPKKAPAAVAKPQAVAKQPAIASAATQVRKPQTIAKPVTTATKPVATSATKPVATTTKPAATTATKPGATTATKPVATTATKPVAPKSAAARKTKCNSLDCI